jgi:hypothetical protein
VNTLGSIVLPSRRTDLASTFQTDFAVCHTCGTGKVRFFTLDSFGMNSDCRERFD